MESRERGLRHGRQFVDFFGRQREVKNVQIFLLMREKRRLRDRGDAALNAPPQSDLGRRLAVGGSDLFEQRMAQQRAAACWYTMSITPADTPRSGPTIRSTTIRPTNV